MLFVRVVTVVFSIIWALMFIMCAYRGLPGPAVISALCCAGNVALYNRFSRKPQ